MQYMKNPNPQELPLKKEEKFRKQHNKMYLSELERRLQCCLRNLPIACKAVQVAKPPREIKKKKMEAICLPSTILMVTKAYLSQHFKPNQIWYDGTLYYNDIEKCGILFYSCSIYVGLALQDAVVEVTEEGTRASAATVAVVNILPVPIDSKLLLRKL